MQLIDNYLNNLQSYLPEEMKHEVRDELEASIMGQVEDKQQALGRELNQQEVESLLRAIGHPMRVASAYLPNQQLIGGEYFPAYKKALELVLVITLAIKFISQIPLMFAGKNLIAVAISVLLGFVDTGIWVFGVVTLVFYLLEKEQVGLDQMYAWSPWSIKFSLTKLPLSRFETLFEMTITLIFLGWWNNWLQWGILQTPEDISPALQFSDEWQAVMWSVNIIIGLGLAVNFYQFLVAGWNKITLAIDQVLNLATLVVLLQISQFESFVTVTENASASIQWDYSLQAVDYSVYLVLAIIAGFILWDSYASIKKFRTR